jgi:hypothetical protein
MVYMTTYSVFGERGSPGHGTIVGLIRSPSGGTSG